MGTGIGLDLAHSLVELHHGNITVQNNKDASGCEFIITLPLGKKHLSKEEILLKTITNLLNSHKLMKLKQQSLNIMENNFDKLKLETPDERLLSRIIELVNKNISNPELTIDSLSEEIGISRVHLYRKMNDLTGQTPHAFIKNVRLKQAARLLTNSNQNISEVAYACGFKILHSFSIQFKQLYGVSPTDYMKERLKNK